MLALLADGRYHVMVVGIDQYPQPAVAAWLRSRCRAGCCGCLGGWAACRGADRRGLPGPRAGHLPAVPFLPPTKANLVARLGRWLRRWRRATRC